MSGQAFLGVHLKPMACGRCKSCEMNNGQACESPRGGCRCDECVPRAPVVDWQARAEKAERINARLVEALEGLLWEMGDFSGDRNVLVPVPVSMAKARAAIAEARK